MAELVSPAAGAALVIFPAGSVLVLSWLEHPTKIPMSGNSINIFFIFLLV